MLTEASQGDDDVRPSVVLQSARDVADALLQWPVGYDYRDGPLDPSHEFFLDTLLLHEISSAAEPDSFRALTLSSSMASQASKVMNTHYGQLESPVRFIM